MSENEKYLKEIEEFREEINKIDDNIVELLNLRGKIVLKLSDNKKLLKLDVF